MAAWGESVTLLLAGTLGSTCTVTQASHISNVDLFRERARLTLDPYEFIREKIDSVPHLEALMLLWNSRPKRWSIEELSARLYVPVDQAADVVRDLIRLGLAVEPPEEQSTAAYLSQSAEQDDLVRRIDIAYRHDLVRISTMIHAKISPQVREFARAFRFRKDRKP